MKNSKKLHLASNIKHLRSSQNFSQEDLAKQLGMSRAKLNSYENSIRTNMPIADLVKVAAHFNQTIDALLKNDLSKSNTNFSSPISTSNDDFITGKNLRVLATTVDSHNNENIEIVSLKAKAGYQLGFFDPDYISSLPTFQLPVITSTQKKYRMFQIDGDSMLPIPDKSYVLAEYLENWNDLKDEFAYVILTKNDGIVFKIAFNDIKKSQQLKLRSLNPAYLDYNIKITEVQEVWRFVSYISNQLPEGGLTKERIANILQEVKSAVVKMKK